MPLYKVAVEVEFYMEAESEDDAYSEAETYAREALGDGGNTTVNAWEVTDAAQVPAVWLGSLPYGGDGERCIAAILKETT